MVDRCKKCKKEIGYFPYYEDDEIKGYCGDCADDIRKNREEEELKKKSPEEKLIISQIKEIEKDNGPTTCVILGVIGLLFFLIPGIILFIIAGTWSHSNHNKIRDLQLKLQELKSKNKKKATETSIPSQIKELKNLMDEGAITKQEFEEKKKKLLDKI